jgi:hypothetical protein
VIVDDGDLSEWFRECLAAFAACGRGESGAHALLAHYGVPLLLSTDDQLFTLMSEDQVVAAAQQQVGGVEADYHHSAVLDSEVTMLNATSALYRATLSRQRSDGNEIGRLTATYLVTDGPDRRRISALAVHSP